VYVEEGTHAPVAELGAVDVARGVIAKLASTVTPQPVVAVAGVPASPVLGDALASATFVVVCDHLSDPGNAGTLVRSAVAAGAELIVTIGSVDAWSPKVVRASAGALFRVPVVELDSVGELGAALEGNELSLVGTRAGDGERYDQFAFDEPVALAFGNESHGLSSELSALVDGWVQIPMHAGTESLNVAMAATVVCFEVARQRRR